VPQTIIKNILDTRSDPRSLTKGIEIINSDIPSVQGDNTNFIIDHMDEQFDNPNKIFRNNSSSSMTQKYLANGMSTLLAAMIL
jgi:hypothetical protein